MFGKKKKKKEENIPSFTSFAWKEDLDFLDMMMKRKIEIVKSFYIDVFKQQLDSRSSIRDEDLAEKVEQTVSEVVNEISPAYKLFLVNKYFGKADVLVKYISETVYLNLSVAAIEANVSRFQKNKRDQILGMNSKQIEEK